MSRPQKIAIIPAAARYGPNGIGTSRPRRASTISTTPTAAPSGPDHPPAPRRAADRGREDHERQHLPAEPCADRAEQLEVAEAHALLAGEQPEPPVDGP